MNKKKTRNWKCDRRKQMFVKVVIFKANYGIFYQFLFITENIAICRHIFLLREVPYVTTIDKQVLLIPFKHFTKHFVSIQSAYAGAFLNLHCLHANYCQRRNSPVVLFNHKSPCRIIEIAENTIAKRESKCFDWRWF